MRVPQVSERVKEAPAQALRAMFAGIGQLLSASDKLRGKSATDEAPAEAKTAAPETATPETATPETATPETATPETATPETATPETATPETATPETATPETATPETATPETATPETATPETATPETATPETATPETDAAPAAPAASTRELPLPNYDDLTIASLRARLRNLSADQLAQLVEYEKSHANRADVIQMFERRIAKLAEG
jgi:outer membrane biosynthesis protein TonB